MPALSVKKRKLLGQLLGQLKIRWKRKLFGQLFGQLTTATMVDSTSRIVYSVKNQIFITNPMLKFVFKAIRLFLIQNNLSFRSRFRPHNFNIVLIHLGEYHL
jgi:hypothetical protein